MQASFWLDRWVKQEIGFHQEGGHPRLALYWPKTQKGKQDICVPLCGKSHDLRYLSQFGTVIGIEVSPIAISDFFSEWGVTPKRGEQFGFPCTSARGVSLLEADFFALPDSFFGRFTHLFDRASMIALPPSMRDAYVAQISRLLVTGGQSLTITIEYPEGEIDGPPFSISHAEMKRCYDDNFVLTHIESLDGLDPSGRLAAEGLTALTRHIFRLTRR